MPEMADAKQAQLETVVTAADIKRQKQREATARWQKKNPEKAKAYYQANKVAYAERSKRSRAANAVRRKQIALDRITRKRADKLANREGSLRNQARALGLKRYQSDVSCPSGHIERWVSSNGCVQCGKTATAVWLSANRDKMQTYQSQYGRDNAAAIIQRKAAHRALHPGAHALRSSAWYEANKEARTITITAWQKANPDKLMATKHNYRTKEKAGGRHTSDDIAFLMKAQSGKCAHEWCRKDIRNKRHLDHIIPIALGGLNDRRNLQILCPTCNLKKSAKHPIDFAQQNGLLL